MDSNIGSNKKENIGKIKNQEEAAENLEKMRREYGILDREVSKEQIEPLSEAIEKEFHTIEDRMKRLEPDLKVYLQKGPDFFIKRLVDPKRFYQEVCKALDNRKEAASFIKTKTIDRDPQEIINELEDAHKVLKDYLDQLKRPEIGVEEIREEMNKKLNDFELIKQHSGIYMGIMDDKDKAEFQKILGSAEKYSNKYLEIASSSSEEDQILKMARSCIKFRETSTQLSEIIKMQQTPAKIQKDLTDLSVSADLYPQIDTQILQFAGKEINQGNLPNAIQAFEVLSAAKKELSDTDVVYQTKSYEIKIEGKTKSYETQKEYSDIGDKLYRAKKGLERFKKSYESGSLEWKKLLTSETMEGKALQAMYLGLKPVVLIESRNENLRNLISTHAKEDFQFVDDLVFVESSVKKVLTNPEHSEYFDDYDPNTPAHLYLSNLYEKVKKSAKGESQKLALIKKQETQFGLLVGYPPEAVRQYGKHVDALTKFIKLRDVTDLSNDEKALLDGYLRGNITSGLKSPDTSAFKVNQPADQFRDDHQSELRAFIEKRLPELGNEATEYLISRRTSYLFGMPYVSDKRISSDKYYCSKLYYIFNKSGIYEYTDYHLYLGTINLYRDMNQQLESIHRDASQQGESIERTLFDRTQPIMDKLEKLNKSTQFFITRAQGSLPERVQMDIQGAFAWGSGMVEKFKKSLQENPGLQSKGESSKRSSDNRSPNPDKPKEKKRKR